MIVLVITAGFALYLYADELTELAFVPSAEFEQQEPLAANIYAAESMWHAHPKLAANNPGRWRPDGAAKDEVRGPAAVFFVHPTSFISRSSWNAAIGDKKTADRTRTFLRGLSSPFDSAGEIWAPKYRQASIGAFLTKKPEGQAALDAAYQDVLLAFDSFIAAQQKDRPIILAGHSQGARHLTYLLRDRINGQPIASRIVAAYLIGWPVSVEHDLPSMGLPACNSPDQIGCILSWQSFAEPAEYGRVLKAYDDSIAFDGSARKGSEILCTNPLNGGAKPDAGAEANLGTMQPNNDLDGGMLIAQSVPARCDENGFLLIGDPPDMGNYVLPGNNYHVYDIPLYWANTRFDALWRTRQFLAQ